MTRIIIDSLPFHNLVYWDEPKSRTPRAMSNSSYRKILRSSTNDPASHRVHNPKAPLRASLPINGPSSGAPMPPQPARSAFMCFSDSKKEEIMQKHGITRGHDEILKLVADEWKKLSEKDRAFWDEQSRNDKVRYVREKAAWKGPSLVPKRRAKKNPLAPKRPMSAFLKFSQTRRTKVKKENPDMSNTDVSRLLGEMWRKASVQEKAPYREQEAFERAIYNEDIKRFKSELTRLDAESRASHQSIHSHSQTSHRLSPQPSPDDDYHHHHIRPLTSNSIHAFDTLRMDSFEEAPLATSGRGLVPYRPQYTSAHSPYGHAYSYHSHLGYSSPHHGADYPADDPMQRAPIHRRASLDDEDHVPSRSSYFHDVNVGYYSRYP